MRAGPLSDEQVIDLLNHRFIAIEISNDEYNDKGSAPYAEKLERDRIAKETRVKFNMPFVSAADVEAYILAPDGHVHATMRLPELEETSRVMAWLQKAVSDLGSTEGKVLVPPRMRSSRPSGASSAGSFLLSTSRSCAATARATTCGGEYASAFATGAGRALSS